MNHLLKNTLNRTEMLFGTATMERLAKTQVAIFGIGGVGSWCAESLVRSGLMNLTIVDSEIICATNINRQVQATSSSIGRVKVEELRKRLLDINPAAQITGISTPYQAESAGDFDLKSYNYVVDAIDSLQNKVLLLKNARAAGTVLFSSMGAAAKTDPTRIRIDTAANTRVCALARHVRQELRKHSVPDDFLCVYSDEPAIEPQTDSHCGTSCCSCHHDRQRFAEETGTEPIDWCSRKKRINGAVVHITGIFGFMLAGLVLNHIAGKSWGLPKSI